MQPHQRSILNLPPKNFNLAPKKNTPKPLKKIKTEIRLRFADSDIPNCRRLVSLIVVAASLLLAAAVDAKTKDPYKVLGVDKSAGQREIQKAFHKLSLKYHPDKNKAKGAQAKFAEINNAYEILSDEEKRKNYDTYGDEKGNPGFQAGSPGGQDGYTYFSNGGPGQNHFSYGPGSWQSTDGQGGSKSFSFSFSGPGGGGSPFGFGMNDIFSMFGDNAGAGGQFGGFSGSSKARPSSQSTPKNIRAINSKVYKKEIVDQGITWLLFSYTSSVEGHQHVESMIEDVANSMKGALKVGSVNCDTEASLCKDLGIYPRKMPMVYIYSYKASEKGLLVEYGGDWGVKPLKSFCQDHLPSFSKRVDLNFLKSSSVTGDEFPAVVLLSTKKATPVIWRVLSGLYHNRVNFFDVQVDDASDPMVKKLGVDALPAIVGVLPNGEKQVLKAGITVKDLKSAIQDLSSLIQTFEKKNKKTASNQSKKSSSDSGEDQIPLLTKSNFDAVCSDKIPVCIIGGFRSANERTKLESVLNAVSQKLLSRKDSISYALLDATKQGTFLNAFDKGGFKSSPKVLVAYKPRRGTFAAFGGEITTEEVEKFITEILNGDIRFTKTRQSPVLK